MTRANFPDNTFAAYTYDETGYPISVTDKIGTRPVSRDEAGRVKTFTTTRGFAGAYSYDAAGRVVQFAVDTPRGLRTTTYEYDAAGRLWKMHAPMGTTIYTYTDLGQLHVKELPGGRSIEYTYDDQDRLKTQHLTDTPKRTYTYDDQDRITRIDVTKNGSDQVFERYAYTAAGQLKTWWHDRDYVRNDYHYDAGGRLVKTTRRFTASPPGQNSEVDERSLEQCRVSIVGCPFALEIRKYLLNAVPEFGDPTQITSEPDATVIRSMASNTEWVVKTIDYDVKGRVSGFEVPAANVRSNSTSFTYDARGNMTRYGGGAAAYTHDNYLNYLEKPTGIHIIGQPRTVDGRLTAIKDAFGGELRMDRDDQGRILWLQFEDTNGPTVWEIDHDPWGVTSMKRARHRGNASSDIAFQYWDHRGTQLAIHIPNDRVAQAGGYDPYGEPSPTGSSDPLLTTGNPLRWGGRDQTLQDDLNNGLMHTYTMGAREYSSILHSFLQPDPVPGQTGTTDTAYSYVGYDPVNKIDADGRASQSASTEARFKFFNGKKSSKSGSTRAVIEIGPPTGDLVLGACLADLVLHQEDRLIRKNRLWVSGEVECGELDNLVIINEGLMDSLRISIVLIRHDKNGVEKTVKFKAKTKTGSSAVGVETGYYTCKSSDKKKQFYAGVGFLAQDPGILDASASADALASGDAIGQIGGTEITRKIKPCD